MKRYLPLFGRVLFVWTTAIIAVLVINQTMIERQSAEDILFNVMFIVVGTYFGAAFARLYTNNNYA